MNLNGCGVPPYCLVSGRLWHLATRRRGSPAPGRGPGPGSSWVVAAQPRSGSPVGGGRRRAGAVAGDPSPPGGDNEPIRPVWRDKNCATELQPKVALVATTGVQSTAHQYSNLTVMVVRRGATNTRVPRRGGTLGSGEHREGKKQRSGAPALAAVSRRNPGGTDGPGRRTFRFVLLSLESAPMLAATTAPVVLACSHLQPVDRVDALPVSGRSIRSDSGHASRTACTPARVQRALKMGGPDAPRFPFGHLGGNSLPDQQVRNPTRVALFTRFRCFPSTVAT